MKAQGHIAFVRGVDKHGAVPPAGFPCRFAILTWFQCGGDAVDPWPLMRLAIPRTAALVQADSVLAEYWREQRRGVLRRPSKKKIREVDWASMMQSSDDALHDEDFPSRLCFLGHGEAVLYAESEMWSLVGGPLPYHDSVTVSFFSSVPMHEDLHRIFVEEAAKLGVSVGETLQGEPCAAPNGGPAASIGNSHPFGGPPSVS